MKAQQYKKERKYMSFHNTYIIWYNYPNFQMAKLQIL